MHLQRHRIAGRRTLGWVAVLGALLTMVVSVSPAGAADSAAPVLAAGTFSAAPNGNNNWRITSPQTLNLSATDDVAVSKFQYSLDGGATYVDVPVTEGPSATAAVPLSQEGNTTVRYRAVDSSGNFSRGATTNTTLNQASAAGATAIRLASTTGRSAGDELRDRHGRGSGDRDDRDDRHARSGLAGSERDADRSACERARGRPLRSRGRRSTTRSRC